MKYQANAHLNPPINRNISIYVTAEIIFKMGVVSDHDGIALEMLVRAIPEYRIASDVLINGGPDIEYRLKMVKLRCFAGPMSLGLIVYSRELPQCWRIST